MNTIIQNGLGTLSSDDGVAILTMKMDGPVNKLNVTFITGLSEILDHIEANKGAYQGLIVASGHRDWCVGADLDMVFPERDPARILAAVQAISGQFRRLETLGLPVAAALTGTALGGGYELALACHYRVARNDPRVQVGLPEVNLGLFPGAGGTQRLPRLVGLQAGLELITQGQQVRAPKAVSNGMIDDVADTDEAVLAAARKWVLANQGFKQPWDRDRPKWAGGVDPNSELGRNMLMAGCAMLYKKTAGAFPAVEAVLNVVQEGARVTFDAAIQIEGRAFARVATSDQAKDMIRTIWFHRTAAEKHVGLPRLAKDEDPGIRKVAILGGGMMGGGLATVSVLAGYEVVVKDIQQGALDACKAHVEGEIAGKRHLSKDQQAALLHKVSYTLHADALQCTDLVIEAVPESVKIKHAVQRELEPLLSENGIWASNTSALPITELAQASQHKDRFIGLHFFSPVEKMPLLELIKGAETSDQTVARCLAYCRAIQKLPILVNDGYAFYTSRVFASYLMEGVQLVAEGHDPATIEWAAKEAGMVVPPLQVFDEVSIRLGRHILDQAEARTGRSVGGAKALVVKMVDDHERIGRVGGAGFYDYAEGRRSGIWSGLKPLAAELNDGAIPARTGAAYLGRRLLLAQVAEVARAIDDGVLNSWRDAEVGAIFGIGFAPNTGGPCAWMDRQGLPALVDELREMAREHGQRFLPAPALVAMAERGERFFHE